jgi:hypothetical protein
MKALSFKYVFVGGIAGAALTVFVIGTVLDPKSTEEVATHIGEVVTPEIQAPDPSTQPPNTTLTNNPEVAKETDDKYVSLFESIRRQEKTRGLEKLDRQLRYILGEYDERINVIKELSGLIIDRGFELQSISTESSQREFDNAYRLLSNEYADSLKNLLTESELDRLKELHQKRINGRNLTSVAGEVADIKLKLKNLTAQQAQDIEIAAKDYLDKIYVEQISLADLFILQDVNNYASVLPNTADTRLENENARFVDHIKNLLTEEQLEQWAQFSWLYRSTHEETEE